MASERERKNISEQFTSFRFIYNILHFILRSIKIQVNCFILKRKIDSMRWHYSNCSCQKIFFYHKIKICLNAVAKNSTSFNSSIFSFIVLTHFGSERQRIEFRGRCEVNIAALNTAFGHDEDDIIFCCTITIALMCRYDCTGISICTYYIWCQRQNANRSQKCKILKLHRCPFIFQRSTFYRFVFVFLKGKDNFLGKE